VTSDFFLPHLEVNRAERVKLVVSATLRARHFVILATVVPTKNWMVNPSVWTAFLDTSLRKRDEQTVVLVPSIRTLHSAAPHLVLYVLKVRSSLCLALPLAQLVKLVDSFPQKEQLAACVFRASLRTPLARQFV
jgi:hypothetical protein